MNTALTQHEALITQTELEQHQEHGVLFKQTEGDGSHFYTKDKYVFQYQFPSLCRTLRMYVRFICATLCVLLWQMQRAWKEINTCHYLAPFWYAGRHAWDQNSAAADLCTPVINITALLSKDSASHHLTWRSETETQDKFVSLKTKSEAIKHMRKKNSMDNSKTVNVKDRQPCVEISIILLEWKCDRFAYKRIYYCIRS